MNPGSEHIEKLFLKYLQHGLDNNEQRELDEYMTRFPELRNLFDTLSDRNALPHELDVFRQFAQHAQLPEDEFVSPQQSHSRLIRFLKSPIRVAAAFLLLTLSVAAAVYISGSFRERPQSDVIKYANDVPAGSDKAILTLGDGRTIVLDEASRGLVAAQADSKVIKEEDGQLVYKTGSPKAAPAERLYNTIRTPRGGSYQITLPDGTRAWMNAASSLRFPTAFGPDLRMVEVSGEVYFDVSKDGSRPFRVKLRDSITVEVLGTEFNVNAYEGEETCNTTLASGKVTIKAFGKQVLLAPGQQARIAPALNSLQVKKVNLLTEISWKDGYFYFDDQPLEVIMKRIERWYDVQVEYTDRIDRRFNILMLSRDLPVSRLLEMMELTGLVKFSIDGRRITVMK